MKLASGVFASRRRYEAAQRLARAGRGPLSKLPPAGPLAAWGAMRELPEIPGQSFRDWFRTRPAGARTPARSSSPVVPPDGPEAAGA